MFDFSFSRSCGPFVSFNRFSAALGRFSFNNPSRVLVFDRRMADVAIFLLLWITRWRWAYFQANKPEIDDFLLQKRWVFAQGLNVLVDLPFVLCLLTSILTPYRIPSTVRRLARKPDMNDKRKVCGKCLLFVFFDTFALFSTVFLLLSGSRTRQTIELFHRLFTPWVVPPPPAPARLSIRRSQFGKALFKLLGQAILDVVSFVCFGCVVLPTVYRVPVTWRQWQARIAQGVLSPWPSLVLILSISTFDSRISH
eukprot:GABV01001168.1.p1 GENE.GABV01001168.1~~GABV01001168.1.p1  ORF type:complete len:270 (+),score=54.08 GABV01001168.1:54-812(+)